MPLFFCSPRVLIQYINAYVNAIVLYMWAGHFTIIIINIYKQQQQQQGQQK